MTIGMSGFPDKLVWKNTDDWDDLIDRIEDDEAFDEYYGLDGPDPDLAYDMAREERLFGI